MAERREPSKAEVSKQVFHGQAMMSSHLTQNRAERARFERIVRRHGQMMLAAGLRGEPTMRTTLPGELISERPAQGLLQVGGAKIARELHARASTSSNTR